MFIKSTNVKKRKKGMGFEEIKISKGFSGKNKRVKNDFYPTPTNAIIPILEYIENQNVWECACGDGAISSVLVNAGFNVISTDLNDYGYGKVGVDFLSQKSKLANTIVTNPPYNLINDFIEKANKLDIDEFLYLLPLDKLNGKARTFLMQKSGLYALYSFRGRLKFCGGKSPMMFHCWYHFKRGYVGDIKFKFIDTDDGNIKLF